MSVIGRALAVSARQGSRADPVSLEEFGYLIGRGRGDVAETRSGIPMSANRALGISAWYSGCRYLAEGLASLPVHTYRDTRPKGRSRRSDPPWRRKPDSEDVWFAFIEFAMMSLLHRGNAYAFKLRNNVGQVTGLRKIHPDRVTPAQAPDGTKRFRVDRLEQVFSSREVLHIPGLSYDGVLGLSPIRAQANTLAGVAAADDYSQRFFGQGTHVGGIISVPQELSDDERKRSMAEWRAFHEGLRNAHQTGVLGKGATYQKLALNAEDAQLIESRQYGVTEIARVLRIPPHKLYELTRATFSNIEHQAIEAVVDSKRPWAVRLEAWTNADPDLLPAGNFIEFQLEGDLRGDTSTRYEAYSKAVGRPWMRGNEARRLENLEPVDGLDEVLSPLNMTSSSKPGDEPPGPRNPPPPDPNGGPSDG